MTAQPSLDRHRLPAADGSSADRSVERRQKLRLINPLVVVITP
jgi:hypothetical protein